MLGISCLLDLLASLAGFCSTEFQVFAHDTKAHGEVKEYLHSILTFEKRCQYVASRYGSFATVKALPVPIKQEARWTYRPPGSFGEEINLLALTEIAPPFHVFPARSLIAIQSDLLQLIGIVGWLVG